MKGADAVICAIGSSGFNPKGPKTVDYGVHLVLCIEPGRRCSKSIACMWKAQHKVVWLTVCSWAYMAANQGRYCRSWGLHKAAEICASDAFAMCSGLL